MERDGRRKRSRGSRTLANRARNAHAALVPNARWRPGLGQRRSDGQRLGPPVRVEASHAMNCSGHERRGAMVGGQLWASPDSVATIVPLGIARAPSWAGWGQRCCGTASARPAFVVPAAAIPAGAHGPGLERARPNPAAGSFLRPSLVTSTDASEAMPRLTSANNTAQQSADGANPLPARKGRAARALRRGRNRAQTPQAQPLWQCRKAAARDCAPRLAPPLAEQDHVRVAMGLHVARWHEKRRCPRRLAPSVRMCSEARKGRVPGTPAPVPSPRVGPLAAAILVQTQPEAEHPGRVPMSQRGPRSTASASPQLPPDH